jgi:hypothetical protein
VAAAVLVSAPIAIIIAIARLYDGFLKTVVVRGVFESQNLAGAGEQLATGHLFMALRNAPAHLVKRDRAVIARRAVRICNTIPL